jgi:SAM-dependent methyltransferase
LVFMANAANSEQHEYWNGPGGQRWVAHQEALDRTVRPFGQAALARLALRPGEHVLDVGCGTGETLLAIAEQVGKKGSVTGIDLSAPMLSLARARAPFATLLEGDASAQPFARKFDALYSRFGVMFFADPIGAFTHLGSALLAGGRLAFACWGSLADNPWYTLPMAAARAVLPEPALPWQDDAGPGPFAFADQARVIEILSAAGFCAIDVAPCADQVVLSQTGLAAAVQFALTVGPASRLVKDAAPEDRQRVAEAVGRALAPHVHGDQLIVQGTAWVVSARVP